MRRRRKDEEEKEKKGGQGGGEVDEEEKEEEEEGGLCLRSCSTHEDFVVENGIINESFVSSFTQILFVLK